MNLIAAQSQGLPRQRPRTSVGRKWIGPGTPRQIVVDVLPERSRQKGPVDPLGRAAEGRDCYSLETEAGRARCYFVPDQRYLPVQPVRFPVQRSVTNRSNEADNDIIVDVTGPDPTGARIPGKAG